MSIITVTKSPQPWELVFCWSKIWQYIFKVNIRKSYDSIKTRNYNMHRSKKIIHIQIDLELKSKISLFFCRYNIMTEHKIWMHFVFCIVCKPLALGFLLYLEIIAIIDTIRKIFPPFDIITTTADNQLQLQRVISLSHDCDWRYIKNSSFFW